MNNGQRQEQIEAIVRDNENVVSRDIPLRYHGESKKVNVYRIPLEYLVYNQYNGRIASQVKVYECRNHPLNPEDDNDKRIIEDMLWESKPERNKKTMLDLVLNGQLRYGIVTADGVIIDGNRRASLLSRAYRERNQNHWKPGDVEKCQFFNAVVLPQSATAKDIQQLETTYQMGEDEKLDYNPIEKYLKCRDLKEVGFDEEQIAEMMSESVTNVRKWITTLALMDEYLEYLNYQDMYPMLEHVEDQFLSLSKGLKDWREHSVLAKADWEYDDTDVDDLKLVSFDYIRFGYEGKDFRRICKPSKEGSIFQNGNLWVSFRDQHFNTMDSIDEASVEDSLAAHPEVNTIDELRSRDNQWKSQADNELKHNFRYSIRSLEDSLDNDQPEAILRKVLTMLNSIDTTQQGFTDNETVASLVSDINKTTYQLKKKLGQ
jgi:hypothetical protein